VTAADGFLWKQEPWGPSLRSITLGREADHLFTTRQLRLRGDGERDEWALVAHALGVPAERLVRLSQVHGCDTVIVRRGDPVPVEGNSWRRADILATDDPTLALAVQVADCVPLLMAERGGRAVAAVHAGWRGTCSGAAVAAVKALERAFDVRPEDLVVALGPSIGACCYVVGDEVLERFAASCAGAARWFQRHADGSLRLDLWAANVDALQAAGVPRAAIRVPRLCTACHPELFHSYRRDGRGTGRVAGAIRGRA
jgi:YfiH family protein